MEIVGQLFYMLLSAGAVYGAIRADLKHLMLGVERAERSAARAHERIDMHLTKG